MKLVKHAGHLAALLVNALLLQGCLGDISVDVRRTSSTPTSLIVEHVVPLGHNECTDIQVVGPDISCGPLRQETTCTTTANSCTPSLDYPSCQHTEHNCNWVKDFDAKIRTQIDFDPRSVLAEGETETYRFVASYDQGVITLKPQVKSAKYTYAFPQQVQFDYRQLGHVRFQIAAPPHRSRANSGLN